MRSRLELLYEEYDGLSRLRERARREMLKQVRAHAAFKILKQVKTLGPVRIALIIGVMKTPFRFRSKRQLWPYCGLAVETASSADHEIINGKLRKRKRAVRTRGLNRNHNRTLKYVFKGAAVHGTITEPFKQYYEGLLAKGVRPEMATLTLARKIAAITLAVWKKGDRFDAGKLKPEAKGSAKRSAARRQVYRLSGTGLEPEGATLRGAPPQAVYHLPRRSGRSSALPYPPDRQADYSRYRSRQS